MPETNPPPSTTPAETQETTTAEDSPASSDVQQKLLSSTNSTNIEAFNNVTNNNHNLGKEIGLALCDASKSVRALRKEGRKKLLVSQFALDQTNAVFDNFGPNFKNIREQHKFLSPMIARIIVNKLRPAKPVTKELAALDAVDGDKMGATFAACLASNSSTDAAVGEFIAGSPALKEFVAQQDWFTPMLEILSLRLIKEATWGTKFRLYFGAAASVADMVSDINMIVLYLSADATKRDGWMLLGMVSLCLLLQLSLVILQNRKAPKRKLLWETLILLSCCKPGVDAARVASGKEHEKSQLLHPYFEMSKLNPAATI